MNRERIIRLVVVLLVIGATIAFAGGDSATDPDANLLLPLLLFLPRGHASTP